MVPKVKDLQDKLCFHREVRLVNVSETVFDLIDMYEMYILYSYQCMTVLIIQGQVYSVSDTFPLYEL